MIPSSRPLAGSPFSLLPPGLHAATLEEVEKQYATNLHRRKLFDGLMVAAALLRNAGCRTIYLDGSFVTDKPKPNDYDGCWDPTGVDPAKLDPVFSDFSFQRAAQKAKFEGEFFPSSMVEKGSGRAFVDFMQVDRWTGNPKGILRVSLVNDPMLTGSVT